MPQGLFDDRHQLVTYDLNSTVTGQCVAKGEWIIKLDCNNCPCTVPVFTRNKNGTITINDGYGLVFTISPNEAGGMSCSSGVVATTTEEYGAACDNEFDMTGALLRVKPWEACNDGLPVGSYFYNGLLYLNMVEGNKDKPTTGAGKNPKTWLGGFELYDLMRVIAEMQFETSFNKMLESYKPENSILL